MLEITRVYKTYDNVKKALIDVSLSVKAGDLYGFIGHNGAGKTTLLKSIAGVLAFDKGEILVDGRSVVDEPLRVKHDIAYIPDNPNVYESMTGNQYVDFIANIYGIDPDARRQRIGEYATMFEISDVLHDTIASYSRGMKQKLVITGALIREPKLLMLDEPFVGLDPKASFLLKQVFDKLRARGTAIFFSTHVLDVAEKLCNRIAIIKHGQIVAAGTTKEVIKDTSLEGVFMELLDNHERLS